jgi:hypothetical protein
MAVGFSQHECGVLGQAIEQSKYAVVCSWACVL